MKTYGEVSLLARGWFCILVIAMGSWTQVRAESSASVNLSAEEQAAVFKAAGYKLKGKEWRACDTDDSGASYSPGVIEQVRDINGDGRPDAVVTEGGTYCYGNTGTGFTLLSKQADGRWRVITGNTGIPEFLTTRGKEGWPDISVGGPGFCFPVERWDGKTYKLNRFEYEGKRCKPQR
ncbi:MAG: VCBS repeat-containing protein [Thiobacillaceae bacterium]